jgi:hypothetical protein
MFAACVAFPAGAAKKSSQAAAPPSWEECNDQAVKHGMHRSQRGHDDYIKECQAGRIPVARASAGLSYEQCEARALAQGLNANQNGHIAFVRQCMGNRPGSRRGG